MPESIGTPTDDAIERFVGMERYLTHAPGIGGRLKTFPEDFVVEEVPLAFPPAVAEGKYTIASLRVRNWETNRLVQELARNLRISREAIFFAGTKDKRAVTTQYVSLRAPLADVQALDIRDVEVLETHRVDRAPKIGELVGNRFVLRIRDFEGGAEEAMANVNAIIGDLDAAGRGFPNYFGLQRFGTMRPITHLAGRAIIAGDLEEAVRIYVGNPLESEQDETRAARLVYEETRDPARSLEVFPRYLGFERQMLEHLVYHPGDFEGAIFRLPPNLRTMLVYAEQSLLFNRMISKRLDAGVGLNDPQLGDIVVGLDAEGRPERDARHKVTTRNLSRVKRLCESRRALVTGAILGTDGELADGMMGEIERSVMAEAGYSLEDFGIPHLPEVASYGTRRELLAPLGPVKAHIEKDAHGTYIELAFFLLKGSYATCLLREFLKSPAANYS